jgi:surface antigen
MSFTRKVRFASRLAIAIIVSAAVAAGVLIAAPAAYAGTDDYPAKWKSIPRDTTFDSWGEYNRECTSWVAWRLHGHNKFEMPFHANADDWGAKAKKLGYTVNMTPAVGSVAWYDTNTRSHVAWVEAVYPNNTVEIEEYNIGGSGKYDQTTIPTASVSGYIHFQDLATNFADGAYITYLGNVYRMAGGAPVFVSTWAAFGKTPTGLVNSVQWKKLPMIPKDGTFIQGATSKKIYRIVGGAPIYISSWTVVGGKQAVVAVPDATIASAITAPATSPSKWEHLNFYPTGKSVFVTASPSKKVYQIVGNTAVPLADWSAFNDVAQPTITIGDDDIVNAGAVTTSAYAHIMGFINLPVPTITGKVKVGSPLTASLGTFVTTHYTLAYTWYRDGHRIAAKTATIVPRLKADAGTKFTVKISASRVNFVAQAQTSPATIAMLAAK